MKTQQIFFLICVGLVAWLGFSHGRMTNESVMAASVAATGVAVAAAAEGCPISVQAISIERVEIGTVSETFLVKWATPSVCVTSFRVTLNIRRADGSTRDETQNFAGSARQGLFKLLGKRDDKLTTRATATVNASGLLAAKATQSKALNIVTGAPVGPGTGSNNPTPVPTFSLRGQILNSQTGGPLAGVTLEFETVGSPLRKSSVETNNQGRWTQDGFLVGKQVRITASKRFFVIEPATRTASEGGVVQFSGRPNEIGAPAPTPAAATFSAGGQAKVDNLSQGTQTPLPGATISFKVLNAKPGQANVPGPVTTGKDGKWSQSGFTVGSFTYQATITKSGVTFGFSTANFGSSTGATVGDVGFLGTIPGTPAPAQPFAASGTVNFFSSSQGTATPLAGATITFRLKNPNAGAANVPGSVTTQSNGNWSQSGFTGGVLYIATCTKTGVFFGDVREFNGPIQALDFLGKSK